MARKLNSRPNGFGSIPETLSTAPSLKHQAVRTGRLRHREGHEAFQCVLPMVGSVRKGPTIPEFLA